MRILAYILLFTFGLHAQTYPPAINLDNVETENYTPPTELPNYLQPYTNRYGNTVTRISDVEAFGVNSQQLAHNYSKDNPWNSDGTLVKLAGYPAAILDAETYEFLYWANIPGYGRWSNTNPYIMYGGSDNNFQSFDVRTNLRTTIYTFTGYNSVDFGYGEGNQDINDRYVGLIGIKSDSKEYIVFDIQAREIVATRLIPEGDLDWFSVTPSGRYAVAQFRPDGNADNEGMKLFDIDLSNERHVSDYSGHGTFTSLSNGQEVFVQFGNQPQWDLGYSLEMVNLDTEISTNVFYWDFAIHGNSGIWGGHISSTYQVKDWVFISEGCCYNHGTLPSENFAYNVITNEIMRYGKNHSRAQVGYTHEARGSVNRDGTKMIYASNYFQPEVENLNSALAFVVEVPQPTLTSADFATVEKPIKTEYYNMLGQKVNKFVYLPKGIYIKKMIYQNRVEYKKVIL